VTLGVCLFEVGDGELGVMPEGVEGLVSEQFFDVVHVRPAPEHLSRTRPPERMRRDVHRKIRGGGVAAQDLPERLIMDRALLGSALIIENKA